MPPNLCNLRHLLATFHKITSALDFTHRFSQGNLARRGYRLPTAAFSGELSWGGFWEVTRPYIETGHRERHETRLMFLKLGIPG